MRWSCYRIEDSSLRQSSTRRENAFRKVVGNLRFPLTVTYHGCHAFLVTHLAAPRVTRSQKLQLFVDFASLSTSSAGKILQAIANYLIGRHAATIAPNRNSYAVTGINRHRNKL
jgi:hypothetical protein